MALTKEQQDYFIEVIKNIKHGANVALMDVREKATGKVLPMIVGVNFNETGGFETFPLALLIMPEQAFDYDPPIITSDTEFEGTH